MANIDNDSIRRLMADAANGDKAAYKLALVEVERWAKSFYSHRVAPAAVNDLVQETLIAVHNKHHTYDPSQPFRPWLAAIARYKWVDYLREVYRRAEIELPDDLVADEIDDPVVLSMSLRSLMERLKPAQATVLRLVKLQGYSIQEAAQASGQSEALVRVNIHRGLKQLIALVEQ